MLGQLHFFLLDKNAKLFLNQHIGEVSEKFEESKQDFVVQFIFPDFIHATEIQP